MILATLVHGGLLAGLAAWAGAPASVVIGVLSWQIAEGWAATDRPDTADWSASALGLAVLAVVLGSVLVSGGGTAAGLIVVAAGIALRVWAIKTLGPRFLDGVELLPRHELERTGPYRWLAHPGATGTAMAALGVVICAGSLVGGVAWVGLAGLLVLRTRAEDRLLAAI